MLEFKWQASSTQKAISAGWANQLTVLPECWRPIYSIRGESNTDIRADYDAIQDINK